METSVQSSAKSTISKERKKKKKRKEKRRRKKERRKKIKGEVIFKNVREKWKDSRGRLVDNVARDAIRHS